MAQVRGELEGLMANGCDIGQLEALIEKRLKELGRPLLEEAAQELAGGGSLTNTAKGIKDATHRVDYYHVCEHLRTVAHDLYGQTPQARQWVLPMPRWLKRRKDGAWDVINALQEIRADLEKLSAKQQETLDREIGYFEDHKKRMDYKNGKALDQPIGSGAIESTCSQYQCRFKRTGQFWSLGGDEAFLALATLHRNDRWHRLFPHDLSNTQDRPSGPLHNHGIPRHRSQDRQK